ncbi:hypothetical protein Asphe3_02760 [Pseudarthrobacter phenanthrenivorans Sphe3]|uniref:Transcriptional regulator, AbiEi antitoxin, Type IV TA system n=1 Tax=Pseudarthrobacter phenanthrenivorans (strain DSM 18606 / JCM 16027 / LMG 23796 / Sphe3) TaxID=930171 RepID=F0M7U1_PSEPM|nr:hypothetical protein [Pseudarthrobacter phenanthrenivorans]ADX71494.1 hypothetical protein Asphe3_02760 [Pseudarthrobacter phenanthrenivorans Sphe3]
MEILPGLIDSAAILRIQGSTDQIHREFRAGRLVRIRRGFYVRTADWLSARPSARFAWTTAAVARSVKGAVLCGETAALANGLPTLRTPPCVELATTLPGRSGIRRSPLTVLGEGVAARQVRERRSYPLRYCLKPTLEAMVQGEFRCTSPVQTSLDLMVAGKPAEALVVADGLARRLHGQGHLSSGANLLAVRGIAEGIAAHPHASARRRAERVAELASPLAESVGESYSRAMFEFLGFEQPVLQHVFCDSDGFIGRADCFWPGHRVVGEFDGKAKYVEAAVRVGTTPEEAVYREKIREDRIRALGFAFVRWGWADIENPERLRRKLLVAGLRPRIRGLFADPCVQG